MLRPADFSKRHKTTNVTPYQMIASPSDLPERGSSNGGVFHRGQIVWIQESPAPISVPYTAIGFVDGVGHVVIDPRVLCLVDAAQSTHN